MAQMFHREERVTLLEILRLMRALDAMSGAKEAPGDKARYDRIEEKLRDTQAPGFLDKSEEYSLRLALQQVYDHFSKKLSL